MMIYYSEVNICLSLRVAVAMKTWKLFASSAGAKS